MDPPGTVTRQYTSQVVSLVVDLLIGRLNDAFNDRASSLRWVGLRGRTFTSRFLYVLVWCEWERVGSSYFRNVYCFILLAFLCLTA